MGMSIQCDKGTTLHLRSMDAEHEYYQRSPRGLPARSAGKPAKTRALGDDSLQLRRRRGVAPVTSKGMTAQFLGGAERLWGEEGPPRRLRNGWRARRTSYFGQEPGETSLGSLFGRAHRESGGRRPVSNPAATGMLDTLGTKFPDYKLRLPTSRADIMHVTPISFRRVR